MPNDKAAFSIDLSLTSATPTLVTSFNILSYFSFNRYYTNVLALNFGKFNYYFLVYFSRVYLHVGSTDFVLLESLLFAIAMLPIVKYPSFVEDFPPRLDSVFTQPQLKHFARYLTGLVVCENKTATGMNRSFMGRKDQSAPNHWLTDSR